jgi:hypothetical protein
MKNVALALALLFGSASATFYTPSAESQKYMFEEFKAEYSKNYATMEEESSRFSAFVANLKVIDERNAAETGTATHGITKFADMTEAEFAKAFRNYAPAAGRNVTVDESIVALPEGVEALVDWTGVLTTPVKNQGYCGSCWAFSAVEQIESDYIRAYGLTMVLAPQQVTSCDTGSYGCSGGFTESAYTYAKSGLELEKDYPYTSGAFGVTGSCKSSSSKFVVKTKGYTTVSSTASGESKMATYVSGTGPLSVCVDANTWSSYTGGIMSTCGKSVDHCVQAVGINTSGGYWKVRNSWGTSWGESGFIRLKYGANTCAIASDATYASVATY